MEYYATSNSHSPYKKKKTLKGVVHMNEEMKAECYIGFAKLLKEELKTFEMKDSAIFDMRVNSLSRNKN